MEQDAWGNWVISKEYNAAMLAEAVCKLEGFRYEPSEDEYWMHGRSTEQDFIYVTTQTLTEAQLNQLSLDVGSDRTLLVCCGAFKGRVNGWENLTLKKIPQAVLSKCEWGRDDFSLEIRDLPEVPRDEPVQGALFGETEQ
jgi:adenine-specific DNA-methyltransferase